MANGHPVGEVQFDPAKVVSRQEGEELILMHVPSGRFAALNANGKQIWASLERVTGRFPPSSASTPSRQRRRQTWRPFKS